MRKGVLVLVGVVVLVAMRVPDWVKVFMCESNKDVEVRSEYVIGGVPCSIIFRPEERRMLLSCKTKKGLYALEELDQDQ